MNVQTCLPSRLVENAWIYAAAACACYVAAGVYVGRTGSFVPLVALGALGVIALAVAIPRLALVIGLAAMALPYTWGPHVPKLGFGSGVVVGLLLLVACLVRLAPFRPSALDIAVLAFALTPAAIAAFQGQPSHLTNWIAPMITLPYFGFRLLLHTTDARRAFAPAIVAIGVVVSVIGIWEGLSGHNPVVKPGKITYLSAGHYVTTWNVPEYRDGHLRALSTFGHPIAFGMVLLVPLAFALARGGSWNLISAGLILVAEAFTFSRDAWLGCLLVVFLLAGSGGGRRILSATVILVAGATFVGPVHRLLVESGSISTEAGHNTYYRLGLLKHAFAEASLFGHPFINLQNAIPNYPDVTSLVAGTVLTTGIFGLVELALIAGLSIVALVDARRHADPDYRAATVAFTAELVGLSSVTLITNYQFFFWALLAYMATLRQISARGAPQLSPGRNRRRLARPARIGSPVRAAGRSPQTVR